jgi:hypothetical protein
MSDEQGTDDEAMMPDDITDNPLRPVIHQQEVVIAVMRDRILELELELINARCALIDHAH